ncbi:MAG: HU family DNA-binding protein [Actinomycetota bacterium]|nr:HU family DNA-binding protein [Actinomycetota bacterium]
MNKRELVDKVAAKTDMGKGKVGDAVDAVFNEIAGALKDGERVQLTGFGTFEVRERKARQARNPQTGESIQVPASRAPAFKAGKSLKDSINT